MRTAGLASTNRRPIRAALAWLSPLWLLAAPCALAADLRHGDVVMAERALGGDVVALRNGERLRLAGILAPHAGDRGKPRAVAAAAAAARAELDALVRGRSLRLRQKSEARDRYGRIRAEAALADGRILADEMLRRGYARVFATPDAAGRLAAMLALEREARAARRGLWALAAYAVRRDTEAGRYTDSYQLVEGTVLKAGRARAIFYLNFGDDYRRDFTVALDRPAVRAFRRAGLDPASLAGKRIRVRGWLIWRNGPYIAVAGPAQVEVLE
jgi:endonuclease YncB( thermonuclease family)